MWLPRLGNGRLRVQHIDTIYSIVSDLIDVENLKWKEDVIREIMVPEQADSVLCIPLLNPIQPDELVWRGDNTVDYTVSEGRLPLARYKRI